MFERIRFARYALKFERAFKTDQWDEVKACFHADATYTVAGTATEWDTTVHGPDAIAAFFKRLLDIADRRYDARRPALTGLPRVRGGELYVPWRAHYRKGEQRIVLHGESRCRFNGDKIIALSDMMRADESQRWLALVATR